MSDRMFYQERPTHGFSNRSLLSNASADDIQNIFEKDMLLKYQDILRQLIQKKKELHDIRELLLNIHAGVGQSSLSDMKNDLQKSVDSILTSIASLDRKLIELEQDAVLQKVIEREKKLAYQREVQRGKEALERERARAYKTQRELMERYQASRQQAIQKREQAKQQQQEEAVKGIPTVISEQESQEKSTNGTPKEEIKRVSAIGIIQNVLSSISSSKRITAIVSLLLCVVLYFSLLTTVFSTKVNTYICYTQENDSSFHSLVCYKIRGASVTETTIHQASKKYTRCQTCNPSDKTTITDRNFVAPALISVSVSVAIYFLLAYKKND